MRLLRKKNDPISVRAKALNAEIAALQVEIQKLNAEVVAAQTQPPARSNTHPAVPASIPANGSPEPVFENVEQHRLKAKDDEVSTPTHYNELGVRKFNLPAVWRQWLSYFRGPPPANQKLVNYLAAGSIQGLRPLRY